MNLVIDITEGNKKSIVNLSGEIDAYTAPKLKEALIPLTVQNGHVIEVDMKEVNYMDSTGLGIFINALKNTKEYDSQMKLVNLKDRVSRLFEITGLDEIIDINAAIRGGNK